MQKSKSNIKLNVTSSDKKNSLEAIKEKMPKEEIVGRVMAF